MRRLYLVFFVVLLVVGCSTPEQRSVVVYVALDEMFSRPILDQFERESGYTVKAVYDTEASKTTGLRTRLAAEKTRPRADVFWNNEVAQTILLKEEGVLEPYVSPRAAAFPERFKDAEGLWTGFAARGRVIIYNTHLVTAPPKSIYDLVKPEWRGKAAIARPLFGTTATHAAALFALWGEERAKAFFQDILANDIAVLEGNATVRDRVAAGDYAWGLTDTDDANGAVVDGLPAKWLFPDQEEGGLGTLLIPNTVALVKNGPNPVGGKALIDFLLSAETERRLSEMRSIQIPLNPIVDAPTGVPKIDSLKAMAVTFDAVAEAMPASSEFIKQEFLK